jgi:hypothetical protein
MHLNKAFSSVDRNFKPLFDVESDVSDCRRTKVGLLLSDGTDGASAWTLLTTSVARTTLKLQGVRN